MLGCAIRWGYIVRNPAEGLERPRREDVGEMKVLARQEVDRLLAACSREAYLPVLTAVSTGVRRGELFGLQWRDLDRDARRLWGRRSVNRHGQIQEPKTRRSVRSIALPSTVVTALLEHRMRPRFAGDGDLIFPSRTGGPMDAGKLRQEGVQAGAEEGWGNGRPLA